MIEKVVNRIDKLEKPHLKLAVMHDFMWALIEEQASDRAHQHRVRNQDSGCHIWVVESEAHDISQSIINHALRPGQPTVCEYVKGQSLMVNMLWEVAYGVCNEVLHLDSLEDFNTTEVDLMELKKMTSSPCGSLGTGTRPHPSGPLLPLHPQGLAAKGPP